MPTILSFAFDTNTLYAAGPEGLFQLNGEELSAMPQPMTELTCCAVTDGNLLVGGLPHGIAFRRADDTWQAAWMDGVNAPALCIAPAPGSEDGAVLLAGTAGGGILRSATHGQSWAVSSFGLHEFSVLALIWAPPAPETAWPAWEVVFAGTEGGLYRSPNGGRGWKRCDGVEGVMQCVAISPDFHTDGLVLAGAEAEGLWRSCDGGRSFSLAPDAPPRVDSLLALADGWLLGSPDGLWRSNDGLTWQLTDGPVALTLLSTPNGVYAGGEFGAKRVKNDR